MLERPGYGYALQQQIAQRLGFLGLADTAVYKTLERLEQDAWVEEAGEKEVGRTRRGAPRVMYRPTARGVEQFKRWMATPSHRSVLRDELQAKLVLSRPEDLPYLIKAAESQAQECLAELAVLGRPGLADARSSDVPWNVAARMMVDDFEARRLASLVDWLDAICEVMTERLEASSGPEPG